MVEALVRARAAYARNDFAEAVEAFVAADAEESLSAHDLHLLAEAAWWSGDGPTSIASMERAFTAYHADGQNAMAARIAIKLCHMAARRLAFAVAGGWLAQAERLLADEPEGPVHAWLSFTRMMFKAFGEGDRAGALQLAERTLEIARRYGNVEVESLVLSIKGQVLVGQGRWKEGLELVDVATGTAVSGALEPRTACEVYCFTISTCRNLFDYRRAGEWTDEAERFMNANSFRGYPGVCRVHRAELKRLQGAYDAAETEARDACDELEAFHLHDVLGFAHNEVGEVRLRRGDLAGAEESFRRAHEFGRDPQPGWALMMLARGRLDEAAEAIDRSLGGGSTPQGAPAFEDRLRRSRLLPARVEIALAVGDLDAALAAVEELEGSARTFDSAAIDAAAVDARGALQLARGDPAAVATLEQAWRAWQRMRMPYEGARARLLLGRAHAAAGATGAATMEIEAARASFEVLGAALDARRANELLREVAGPRDPAELRVTKTFMFTDVVGSTDLVRVMGDAAWERLIDWHDRTLRAIIAEHQGEIVRHTGDGFFVTFDDAAEAVACAVAVQRRLERARGEQGFAPSVRIGLHSSAAGRHGDDYAGLGVHVAARVADLAGGDEILASTATVELVPGRPATLGDARTVEVKGVEEAIEVVTISSR